MNVLEDILWRPLGGPALGWVASTSAETIDVHRVDGGGELTPLRLRLADSGRAEPPEPQTDRDRIDRLCRLRSRLAVRAHPWHALFEAAKRSDRSSDEVWMHHVEIGGLDLARTDNDQWLSATGPPTSRSAVRLDATGTLHYAASTAWDGVWARVGHWPEADALRRPGAKPHVVLSSLWTRVVTLRGGAGVGDGGDVRPRLAILRELVGLAVLLDLWALDALPAPGRSTPTTASRLRAAAAVTPVCRVEIEAALALEGEDPHREGRAVIEAVDREMADLPAAVSGADVRRAALLATEAMRAAAPAAIRAVELDELDRWLDYRAETLTSLSGDDSLVVAYPRRVPAGT